MTARVFACLRRAAYSSYERITQGREHKRASTIRSEVVHWAPGTSWPRLPSCFPPPSPASLPCLLPSPAPSPPPLPRQLESRKADVSLLRRCRLVGMTTSELARQQELVAAAGAKVGKRGGAADAVPLPACCQQPCPAGASARCRCRLCLWRRRARCSSHTCWRAWCREWSSWCSLVGGRVGAGGPGEGAAGVWRGSQDGSNGGSNVQRADRGAAPPSGPRHRAQRHTAWRTHWKPRSCAILIRSLRRRVPQPFLARAPPRASSSPRPPAPGDHEQLRPKPTTYDMEAVSGRWEVKGVISRRRAQILGADGCNSAAHLISCSGVAVNAAPLRPPHVGSPRCCRCRGYELDVSLFERLATRWGQAGQQDHDRAAAPGQQQAHGGSAAPGPAPGPAGVPVAVLARQRRMRPCISALLRPVYPHLEDHPCVQVEGRGRSKGGRGLERWHTVPC